MEHKSSLKVRKIIYRIVKDKIIMDSSLSKYIIFISLSVCIVDYCTFLLFSWLLFVRHFYFLFQDIFKRIFSSESIYCKKQKTWNV